MFRVKIIFSFNPALGNSLEVQLFAVSASLHQSVQSLSVFATFEEPLNFRSVVYKICNCRSGFWRFTTRRAVICSSYHDEAVLLLAFPRDSHSIFSILTSSLSLLIWPLYLHCRCALSCSLHCLQPLRRCPCPSLEYLQVLRSSGNAVTYRNCCL